MDVFTEIIKSLSKEEARNFKLFEQRIRSDKYDKKLVKLYDLVRSGEYGANDIELVSIFYDETNRNAFYRLKHRLVQDIEKSLLLIHANKDSNISILNILMLARIFYFKPNYQLAYHYLQKAEKQAKNIEAYDMLCLIYSQFIELSKHYTAIDPQIYIDKKQDMENMLLEYKRIDYLLAKINHELNKTNFAGKNQALLDQLEELQKSVNLLPENQSPTVKLQIHKCVRECLLQKKDFANLEVYLNQSYYQFKSENIFTKSNHYEKITLLTWIINTFTKTRKFHKAFDFTQELEKALFAHNKLFYAKYVWTYYQSLTVLYSTSGNMDKAIELLEELKHNADAPKGVLYYDIFIYINLVKLYFNTSQFKKANNNLHVLLYQDKYRSLDKSIKLNLCITEIMIRMDMEDLQYAASRLREIKRKFHYQLNLSTYKREKEFIKILSKLLKSPKAQEKQSVRKHIQVFLDSATYEVGSNNAINYKAWLYAKMTSRPYLEIILSWLHPSTPQSEGATS